MYSSAGPTKQETGNDFHRSLRETSGAIRSIRHMIPVECECINDYSVDFEVVKKII